MVKVLVAAALIFAVLVGWLYVEAIYRRFARRHPELGPYRDNESGCGKGGCSCQAGSCHTDYRRNRE